MTCTSYNLPDKTYIFFRIIDDDDNDTTGLVKTSSDNTFDCTASIVYALFDIIFVLHIVHAHTQTCAHTHTQTHRQTLSSLMMSLLACCNWHA